MNASLDRYGEVFTIEIEGWCYGVRNYPGELFPGLIHAVIRELAPTFRKAIEHHVAFDIVAIAKKFEKVARGVVKNKEIAFSILSRLPNPLELDEDAQYVLAQVVDRVEQEYGGALERLQRKWAKERKALEAKKQAA